MRQASAKDFDYLWLCRHEGSRELWRVSGETEQVNTMTKTETQTNANEKLIDSYHYTEGLTERQADNCYNRAARRNDKGEDYDAALLDEFARARQRRARQQARIEAEFID